jgi:Phage virion morphogenesis family
MSDGWVTVKLDAFGETQIARQFQLAEEWSHDLREPLDELMDMLLDSVRAQFDTEGAAAHGDVWQPLSDEYGAWKAEHYPGRPILVRDGGMKGAMLNRLTAVHVGTEEAVYEPHSQIAGYHQSGADWIGPAWGRGQYPHHLPQRKMVDLSEAFKHEAVDRTFARWIARKLAEGRTTVVPLAA